MADNSAIIQVSPNSVAIRGQIQLDELTFSSSTTLTTSNYNSYFVTLTTPSANATLTLPPHGSISKTIHLSNVSTSSSFNWSISASDPLTDANGNTITTIPNGYSYIIQTDGSGWHLRSSSYIGAAPIGAVSTTINFPSTSANSSSDQTVTVTGAAIGDIVELGVDNAATLTNSSYTAWVSAANTVTIRFNNYSTGTQDPASGTFKVKVVK
jgi:hypothetical protein